MTLEQLIFQLQRAAIGCLLLFAAVFTHLAAAQPAVEIAVESQFGQGGSSPGQFNRPVSLAVDSQNRIIVVEQGNSRYQVCDHQGICRAFGGVGSDPGQFSDPQGVAADGNDRILITESVSGNSRIQICDDQGACAVFRPLEANGIAADSEDRMIIASTSGNGVYICLADFVCSFFGGPGASAGKFNAPRDVAVDSEDRILVADRDNHRIQVCDYNGLCEAFGEQGTAVGQFNRPSGVAVDSFGRIIVADRDNHRIQVCNDTGACVAFGAFGTAPGQFNHPSGIAVDNNNRVVVTEEDGNRIQVLRIDTTGFQINPGLSGSWANFDTLGQGFFIDVLPDIPLIFLAWFTWESEQAAPARFKSTIEKLAKSGNALQAELGDDNHRWITAQGPYTGNIAVLSVTVTSGGIFNDPQAVVNSDPGTQGTITLTFSDCENGLAEYDLTASGLSGQVPFRRLAQDNVSYCDELNSQAPQPE